jgi:hypothetical protein
MDEFAEKKIYLGEFYAQINHTFTCIGDRPNGLVLAPRLPATSWHGWALEKLATTEKSRVFSKF